jgi:putative transposase
MAESEVRRLRELEKENGRLKRLLAERDVELDVVRELLQKSSHARGPAERGGVHREARAVDAAGVRAAGVPACGLLRVCRRWLSYRGGHRDDPVLPRLKLLAAGHLRYGYRRLHVLLRREGHEVNVKRVCRLCVLHGLKLSRKRRRKRRGVGTGVPCRVEYPNHVWAYDFVHDACRGGRKLKILTVEDEFTRRYLAIELERRMPASAVCRALLRLLAEHGTPQFVRGDNGPEFIAKALVKMLAERGMACRHIDPGSPSRGSRLIPLLWQNGLNERFNGSLRDECLNPETFAHADQARAVCRLHRRHHNQERPHSALGYLTPEEFAARCAKRDGNKCEGRCCAAGGGGAPLRKTPRPPRPLSSVAGRTRKNADRRGGPAQVGGSTK